MIAIDTNLLLRLVIKDDKKQYERVLEVMNLRCSMSEPGFITSISLCELIWTLDRLYKYPKPLLVQSLHYILTVKEFFIEHQQEAWCALEDFRNDNADFSDYYIAHISKKHGATKIITFDKKAAKHNMFELIK